jgi:hypothetical protein
MLQYLKVLAERNEWSTQELIDNLAHKFNVTTEERQKRLPSAQKVFNYHVRRARTVFNRAGLIEQTRHGYWHITQNGLDYLLRNPNLENAIKKDVKREPFTNADKKVRGTNFNLFVNDIQYIQALGNLLTYYHSDLIYIREFMRFKNGKINNVEYLQKAEGTFRAFINEFRVARNIEKTKTDILLQQTIIWTSSVKVPDSIHVDGFAESLNALGITHGKVMTSLASKILFLNNPWTIFPMDNLAKKSFRLRSNYYSDYYPRAQDFKEINKIEIGKFLSSVDSHLTTIESAFCNEIENLNAIRINRFVDKILWTIGRNL